MAEPIYDEDINEIVAALVTVLTTAIDELDQSSVNSFLPAVETTDTALIVPVFGQQSEFGTYNFHSGQNYQAHRIRVELWVKHLGDVGSTQDRTRTRLAQVVRTLQEAGDLGLGEGTMVAFFDGRDFDPRIEASVAPEPIEVAGVPFILATLVVPVTQFEEVA